MATAETPVALRNRSRHCPQAMRHQTWRCSPPNLRVIFQASHPAPNLAGPPFPVSDAAELVWPERTCRTKFSGRHAKNSDCSDQTLPKRLLVSFAVLWDGVVTAVSLSHSTQRMLMSRNDASTGRSVRGSRRMLIWCSDGGRWKVEYTKQLVPSVWQQTSRRRLVARHHTRRCPWVETRANFESYCTLRISILDLSKVWLQVGAYMWRCLARRCGPSLWRTQVSPTRLLRSGAVRHCRRWRRERGRLEQGCIFGWIRRRCGRFSLPACDCWFYVVNRASKSNLACTWTQFEYFKIYSNTI